MPSPSEKDALLELDELLTKVNATTMGRRTFLASVPLLLAACATSKTRYREGNLKGDETEMTVADEQRMTQEALPEMRKEYPPLPNPELQDYITGLGNKIVLANGLHNHPYHYNFTVVGVSYVNAFALPAGTVFVTAPLLEMADTEAELAGVIGHELGHIKARHTAQRMDRAKKEKTKNWLFGIGGGLLGGAAGFGIGKLACKKEDNMCLAKAAAIGAAAGVGGGLLIQKFAFMANSQEDEMEADRIGFRTSVKAGYDKNHVGTFYAKLQKMEENRQQHNTPLLSSVADAMSTHPPSKERVHQMEQMSRETNTGLGQTVSSAAFEKAHKLAKQWVQSNKKS